MENLELHLAKDILAIEFDLKVADECCDEFDARLNALEAPNDESRKRSASRNLSEASRRAIRR